MRNPGYRSVIVIDVPSAHPRNWPEPIRAFPRGYKPFSNCPAPLIGSAGSRAPNGAAFFTSTGGGVPLPPMLDWFGRKLPGWHRLRALWRV